MRNVAEKCAHLLHNCPNCKRHFRNHELLEWCPDCQTDLHCNAYPVYGSKFCMQHGGPVPSRGFYGIGRAIVTGADSKFPISQLANKYLQLTTDGRYLSNFESIEIIRNRIMQLAQRIDLNEAPDRLQRIQELWTEYRRWQPGELEAKKLAYQLDAEFEAAFHDYAAWQQMFEALELDRKMVESQVKIAKDLKAILTAEDAYSLAAKLLAAIIEAASTLIVDDETRSRFLKRIQYEFARLVGDRRSDQDSDGPGGSSREIVGTVTSVVD